MSPVARWTLHRRRLSIDVARWAVHRRRDSLDVARWTVQLGDVTRQVDRALIIEYGVGNLECLLVDGIEEMVRSCCI